MFNSLFQVVDFLIKIMITITIKMIYFVALRGPNSHSAFLPSFVFFVVNLPLPLCALCVLCG